MTDEEIFKTSTELLECMFNALNNRSGRVKVLNSSGNNIHRLFYSQGTTKKKAAPRTNDDRERACILRVHPKSRPMRSSRVRSRGGRYEKKEDQCESKCCEHFLSNKKRVLCCGTAV